MGLVQPWEEFLMVLEELRLLKVGEKSRLVRRIELVFLPQVATY